MNCPLRTDELKKLKAFISVLSARPGILNIPQLDFYKEFIEQLGGKVPAGNFKMISRRESHPVERHVRVSRPFERMRTESEGDSDSDFELDIYSGGSKGPPHRFSPYNRIEEIEDKNHIDVPEKFTPHDTVLEWDLRNVDKTGQTIYYTEICKPAMLRVAHLREDHFLTESPVDEYTDRHV